MYIHRNFTHPGGVSPMKQEKVEEGEVKEEKKEKVAYTGPTLPEGVVPEDNSKQGVIKQGKAPAWYENLFQSDNKGRELSGKEKKEEKYALPSTPTWSKFENSKVGESIDAKGIVKEKDGLMNLLGYGKGEEKDLALDATAVVFPAADIAHATTKLAEGKYLDAGLYALFAAVPGTAGPLVKKAKKLLGVGDKAGAEKLLKETIKNNENAIKTNLKPKGGVDGGLSGDAAEVYYKDLEMRTVPVRGGKQFDDPMGEYNSIRSMYNELPNNVVKPGNPVFNEAGELTGYNMDKVKGVDLDTWMKDGNKLSKEMYDDMVTKITDLNKKGIYHGDLKINNIMIDESGTWKLIDPVGFKHASNMGEDMLKVAQEYDAKALKDLGKYVK